MWEGMVEWLLFSTSLYCQQWSRLPNQNNYYWNQNNRNPRQKAKTVGSSTNVHAKYRLDISEEQGCIVYSLYFFDKIFCIFCSEILKSQSLFSKWKADRRFSRSNISIYFLFAKSLWTSTGENLQARKTSPTAHFPIARGVNFPLHYKLQQLSFCACIPEKVETNNECFNLTSNQQHKTSNTSINSTAIPCFPPNAMIL